MADKKIKFKVTVDLATDNPALKDINLQITFDNPLDFNFAKQRMTRHILLNMLRSLRSQSNGLFIRTLGYYDLQNKIIVLVNSEDTSEEFLTQLEQMTKMVLKQNINKPRPTEVINLPGNGRQMKVQSKNRPIRQAQLSKAEYEQWSNKYPNNYGKFKYYYTLAELFDGNLKQFAAMIKDVAKSNFNIVGRKSKTGALPTQYEVYEVWNKAIDKTQPVLFYIMPEKKFFSNYKLNKITSIFEGKQKAPEEMQNITENLSEFPRAKALFDSTVKNLRLRFKSLDDNELQAFMKELSDWTKDYR